MTISNQVNWEKVSGLVPAIVQDSNDDRILMLGYMNQESLKKTEESGRVTFYSRTRQALWTKGETSGNFLILKELALDCDYDTLLVTAEPQGPTCHLNSRSCFDVTRDKPGFGFLGKLEQVITERLLARSSSSYTAQLASEGTKRIAQKVGEEAVEVALASTEEDPSELVSESADLLFHLLLLLQKRGLTLLDVVKELQQRHAE